MDSSIEVYSADEDEINDTIPLPFDREVYQRIVIITSHTQDPAQLSLDGVAPTRWLSITSCKWPSWFWDGYLKQTYYYDNVVIRDGSVLTLDCGSLHREWVFDVAEGSGT